MKKLIVALVLAGQPVFAAPGSFLSLNNTDFVVLIAFLVFVALLVYMGVPGKLTGMLDARAVQIKADLEEARNLRQEAKAVLASYERKQREVQEQSDRIVANAREEAMAAAQQAKADLKAAIARRLDGALDQIASAEASALRQVREQAVLVAVSVAGDVLSRQRTAQSVGSSIDEAIAQVEARLH